MKSMRWHRHSERSSYRGNEIVVVRAHLVRTESESRIPRNNKKMLGDRICVTQRKEILLFGAVSFSVEFQMCL